jgi:uncharacterized protein DUF6527
VRLTDLEPEFVIYATETEEERFARGAAQPAMLTDPRNIPIDRAQGIWFLCPVCFAKNGGPVGTHMVEVSFSGRGVPDDRGSHGENGEPTRWNLSGSGYNDLTLTPSIWLKGGGCGWHGFITNGEVT